MSRQEPPRETELRIAGERALASLKEINEQLRAMNVPLVGRRPRPELRLIQGGRSG